MRWREIIREGGMSDVAAILDELKQIKTAKVSLDPDRNVVYVDFTLNGQAGSMRLAKRPVGTREETKREYRKKVFAAARAANNGKPPQDWNHAVMMASGMARPMTIKILTNPVQWEIEGLSYGGFKF